MRPFLLALIIAIAGVSKSIPDSNVHKNGNVYKVKKGDTAVQIAKRNGITVVELGTLNPKINLARLDLNTVLTVSKKQQIAVPTTHSTKQHSKENIVVPSKKLNAAPILISLPEIPVINNDSLVHFEQVLPFEINKKPPILVANKSQSIKRMIISRMTIGKSNNSDELITLKASNDKLQPFNLNLLWPVETRTISSNWGPRVRTRVVKVRARGRNKRPKLVLKHFVGNHKGVDLNAPKGYDIFAAMNGQVLLSERQKAYGNVVTIDHGNGIVTLYGHCDRNLVAPGDIVYKGQKIAEVGSTGNSTGPHVHFELRLNGTAHNPLPFMNTEITPNMVAKIDSAKPLIVSKY